MMLILLSRGAKKGGEKKSHFCPRKGRMRFPQGQELQSKSRIMRAQTKGTYQKRFSGIRPLRGGGVPPFSAKEKNLLFSH